MREGTKHRLLFNLYVDLGPGRSLEALAAAIARNPDAAGLRRAPSLRSLYRWSAELRWQDRLADLEREARRRDAEQLLQSLREMNERQAREGMLLQQRAVQRLQALVDGELTPAESIRALAEGARLERLARGEVTDRTQIDRSQDVDLRSFSTAELRALAELALERTKGNSAPQPGEPR